MALGNGFAELPGIARQLPGMATHPDVVPGKHEHGHGQDGGIEQFLAVAAGQIRFAAYGQ